MFLIVICTPTNLRMRDATYWCRGDYTHTNNAGYSNGSSLPVEGLEINDVYVGMLVFVINNNYESGCILQSSMTHHVVSMMTEFRRGFAL